MGLRMSFIVDTYNKTHIERPLWILWSALCTNHCRANNALVLEQVHWLLNVWQISFYMWKCLTNSRSQSHINTDWLQNFELDAEGLAYLLPYVIPLPPCCADYLDRWHIEAWSKGQTVCYHAFICQNTAPVCSALVQNRPQAITLTNDNIIIDV